MKAHIVIVQHTVELGRIFERVLRSHGYPVTLCYDLEQGLRALEDGDADLVLLDKHLPGSNPAQTYEQVHQCAPQVPVLMWGLDWTPQEMRALAGGGLLDFIAGPVEPQALLAHVRGALPGEPVCKIA